MAKVHIASAGAPLSTGLLQLQNGDAMDATLRPVTDQDNTASPLELSTNLVSVSSTLQIATNDLQYIDAEDTGGNNRFTVSRSSGSQVVNVDFASNPTLGTEQVGAIRTYQDGVSLSDSISFLKNGNVGVGTNAPAEKFVIQNDNGNAILVVQANSAAVAQVKRYSNNGTRARYETYKSRGTIQAPLSIQTADEIGSVDFHAYDGSAFQRNGIIYVTAESVSGGLITPAMKFGVGTSAGANQYRLSIFNDGNISIGQDTNASARLGIKGSGSTSATTSLLVQNSSGTELLKVTDDSVTQITNKLNIVRTGNTSQLIEINPNLQTVCALIRGGGNSKDFVISSTGTKDLYLSTNFSTALTEVQFALKHNKGVLIKDDASTAIDDSAKLEVTSTTKGFLPPRMTTAQKNAISSPAAGLMVYDTDLNKLCVYTTAWETITSI